LAVTGDTDITDRLNGYVAQGDGFYNGGKGVIVRNPFDGYEQDTKKKVVPATFIVDDIVVPNKVFPRFESNTFHWDQCGMVYVVGSSMANFLYDFDNIQTDPAWGWGVFYAWDSNAADSRCEYHGDPSGGGWYDCPGSYKQWGAAAQKDSSKAGAGAYPPGNPAAKDEWGGGAGCHFSSPPFGCNDPAKCTYDIDQINRAPMNLVGTPSCECNYQFNNNWDHWVLSMGSLAAEEAVGTLPEAAMCWTNNVKDLISLQNSLWWHKSSWFSKGAGAPAGYWGWNEIPIGREQIIDPKNWDAVVIKMPVYICGGAGGDDNLSCLGVAAHVSLSADITHWVAQGKLVPGKSNVNNRPGSYIVLMREWVDKDHKSHTWFFCQGWTSPTLRWRIKFEHKSAKNPTGSCYLANGLGYTSDVLNQTFEAGVSRSAAKEAHIRTTTKAVSV
jgi:hypothetical protein